MGAISTIDAVGRTRVPPVPVLAGIARLPVAPPSYMLTPSRMLPPSRKLVPSRKCPDSRVIAGSRVYGNFDNGLPLVYNFFLF